MVIHAEILSGTEWCIFQAIEDTKIQESDIG
jgi:hypothetical protein